MKGQIFLNPNVCLIVVLGILSIGLDEEEVRVYEKGKF